MKNIRPLVSVIVAVFNGAEFLEGAVQNILEQGYNPLEIILVDDGSTDSTAIIASKYKEKIHYVYQANQGPAAARNEGLNSASGELIAFLDVDDRWSLDKLHKQVDYLEKKPQVDIVQGLIQEMHVCGTDSAGNRLYEKRHLPYYFFNLGSALYRRSVFERVGYFDDNMRFNEDTDWFLRAWEINIPKEIIQEVMFYYYIHDDNMTREQNAQHSGIVRMFKKHRDRILQDPTLSEMPDKTFQNLVEYLGWNNKAASRIANE